MFNGKMKALTFSYDDGVSQDKRLIKILNKYGLKGTFNINSGLFGKGGAGFGNGATFPHVRFREEEIANVYKGHEVAVHTLTHPFLNRISDEDVIREVEEDRIALSKLTGYKVEGMAYPMGTGAMNEHVAELIRKNTGVLYSRTTTSTYNFELPQDLLVLDPTCHHCEKDAMLELAAKFLTMKPDKPQMFYIWGHAYEFDRDDEWEWFDAFCALISGKDDIFYGTNREILLDTDFTKAVNAD